MNAMPPLTPRRVHLMRLMSIWRSAGWPCRDAIELDIVSAGWATIACENAGHERLRLTDAGIRVLADSRQRNQRSLSAHDRLAAKVATALLASGRIVWRELSLRAMVEAGKSSPSPPVDQTFGLDDLATSQRPGVDQPTAASWRLARPDVFSVRRTSVEAYLHPQVHEVKTSRADLLSDLRHAAKRDAYRWLSSEVSYVLPEGLSAPDEIPPDFGVWILRGSIESWKLEIIRPARRSLCTLPFQVWMALAKAKPVEADGEAVQWELREEIVGSDPDHIATRTP